MKKIKSSDEIIVNKFNELIEAVESKEKQIRELREKIDFPDDDYERLKKSYKKLKAKYDFACKDISALQARLDIVEEENARLNKYKEHRDRYYTKNEKLCETLELIGCQICTYWQYKDLDFPGIVKKNINELLIEISKTIINAIGNGGSASLFLSQILEDRGETTNDAD